MKASSILQCALGAFITAKAIFICSCIMQLTLLAKARFTMEEAQANDIRQRVVAFICLGFFLVVLVMYFIWFFRSKRKSVELGSRDIQYSPGLSVGCHFIPFANLIMPYQAMSELWKSSLNPVDWKNQPLSPAVGVWWTLWILNNIGGYAVFFFMKSGTGIDHLRSATIYLMLLSGISILAHSFLFWLVSQISDSLDSHHAPVPVPATIPPPPPPASTPG
jgi:Na+/melibiose symporter-like transporter